MGLFDKYIKQSTTTEEIHDGYSIVSLNKRFISDLKKSFNKKSNKEYIARERCAKQNDGVLVLPSNYNARAIKYRMQIEGALYDEGIVGIQINESEDFQLDDSDYLEMEKSLLQKDVEIMLFNNQNEKIFLSPDREENIDKIKKEVYKSIIKKREEYGLGIIKKDGFLNKEMSFEEQRFLKQLALEELTNGLYLGNQNLALNLLSGDWQLVKLILQEKHKKDAEKILIYLNINHIILENCLLIEKKNLNRVNLVINDYVHGSVFVKDKQIYGLNERIGVIQEEEIVESKDIRENKIDEIIKQKEIKNEIGKKMDDLDMIK